MGQAHFSNYSDRTIGTGTWSYSFNPSGDVAGATVTSVSFKLFIDYNNRSKVDLGDVDIWIEAPDGKRDNIYDNFDGWGADTDDGNDSDGANDYDISFWGTDSKSRTPWGLDGAQVNGNWKLIVRNDTGKRLDLDFLEVWVDYDAPVDYRVSDIKILGTQQVGQPVLIQSTIENVGDKYKLEQVNIEYLVEGEVIGTSRLEAGLLPGDNNIETELHNFDKIGANEVEVRIVGGPDRNTSNNSRTETFYFDHNQADLAVTDIRVTGNGLAGSNHFITADVKNVGNATHTGEVLLEYLVGGDVIGTQTIGLGGANVMLEGTTNSETELHVFSEVGASEIEVRIANPKGSDYSSANDSYSETFSFAAPPEQPDLAVTDVRVIGGWHVGDEVNIRAHLENIGTEGWNLAAGSVQVEYFVKYENDATWTSVDTDSLTFGLPDGWSNWEDATFTLAEAGPFSVKVEISGNDAELSTDNNSWSEQAGHSREGNAQKTVANSADDVVLATLLARTVYGNLDIPDLYRAETINGLDDDYDAYLGTIGFDVLTDEDFGTDFRPVDELSEFREGGLFVGDQGLASSDPEKWQAQGLVAVGDDGAGNRTLTLTFRGTDPEDTAEAALGQAWTGDGLHDYYESMRPLIDAALAYANDDANAIDKVLVSGHSLGGSTADAFAFVDAHRLDSDIDLTVVSLASAGLDMNFLHDTWLFKGMEGQFDPERVSDIFYDAPFSYYIGISHHIDAVTYPLLNPLFLPKLPNQTLLTNVNIDSGLTSIRTPNMSNDDKPGFNFGAGHNAGLYWANLSQIMADDLMEHYSDQRLIVGLSDYGTVADIDEQAFSVFEDYIYYGDDGNDDDWGGKALEGSLHDDYILGFSGNDWLEGSFGQDLLSGGAGNDTLKGEWDDDILDGGAGDDRLNSGAGNDVVEGGAGEDTLDYSEAFGSVDVYLSMGMAHKLNGRDTISGIENVDGTDQADRLVGDGNGNTLKGGAGNDILRGKGGDDTLEGGTGHDNLRSGDGVDALNGGDGNDVLLALGGADILDGGAGDDFLYGGRDDDELLGQGGNDILHGNRGDDRLDGADGMDTLRGGGGDDDLDGGAENDILFGGNGSDIIAGGSGDDKLWGGAGGGTLDGVRDVFVFGTDMGGFDTIRDWEDGIDALDLSAMGFGSFAEVEAMGSDRATGMRLDFGEGDVLFLAGMSLETFDSSDVILA